MCAALWATGIKRGLPGGRPRPEWVQAESLLNGDASGSAPGKAGGGQRRGRAARTGYGALAYARCESPFGPVHLAASDAGVCAVSLYEDEAAFRARLAPTAWVEPEPGGVLAAAMAELGEYFAGRRRAFTVPLDLARATAFDRRVLAAIAAIPHGETRTYGELAAALGSPGAARAVGHACGRNPVPLLIACHRVLRADGGLGGFGAGGPTVKERLLALERG
jgi:methylated-DNA-[protein]-cysteine S-methyltransferase